MKSDFDLTFNIGDVVESEPPIGADCEKTVS